MGRGVERMWSQDGRRSAPNPRIRDNSRPSFAPACRRMPRRGPPRGARLPVFLLLFPDPN